MSTDDDRPIGFVRKDGTRTQFSHFELRDSVVVTDPKLFLPALLSGIERARALGCDLVLIECF